MRYAIINDQTKEVINVIMWDGVSNWAPPAGHSIKKTHEAGIGDLWHEQRQEFMRPMSRQKLPENEESIKRRNEEYLKNRKDVKKDKAVLFVNPDGNLEE